MPAMTNDQLRAMQRRIDKLAARAVRIMSMGDPHKPDPMEATLALIDAAKTMVLPIVGDDPLRAAIAVANAAKPKQEELDRFAFSQGKGLDGRGD